MDQPTRVLIVDDHAFARKALRALLATRASVEVCCEAVDGQEAVQLVEEYQPDVVLMDIQMPGCDGIQATRSIKARWPQVRVIALTARSTYQAAALSAGADLFLLKGTPTADLVAAIADGRIVRDRGPGGDNGAGRDRGVGREDTTAPDAPAARTAALRPQRLAAATLAG
jgi:CheY-like chemotaxis protein